MRCYLIRDDRVTVLRAAPKTTNEGDTLLESAKNLDQKRFPVDRLLRIWNALPDVQSAKRFTSRPVAVKKVWAALEALPAAGTRSKSKLAQVLVLLKRPAGASLEQLMAATGWQAHSVRGVLSGAIKKRMGLNLTSAKEGDKRIYRVAA